MNKNPRLLMFIFLSCFLLLLPGFYNNYWDVVAYNEYQGWQRGFDRFVVARLVKSRQDGLRSAGGLLGMGDVKYWKYNAESTAYQYNRYEQGINFDSYLAYKSFPGLQGTLFGIFDRVTDIAPRTNLVIFRASVVILSALTMATFLVWLAAEFGWLAASLTLAFIIASEWLTLLAGSLYWSLWAFYLPFVAVLFLLGNALANNEYPEKQLLWTVFITAWMKILFNGFEAITSAFIMITVPLMYFAIRDRWPVKLLTLRFTKLSLVLGLALAAGLIVLAIQIAIQSGGIAESYDYIMDTLNRRAIGRPEEYPEFADGMQASVWFVIWRYLTIPAISIHVFQKLWQVSFLHLNLLFSMATVMFLFIRKNLAHDAGFRKGLALMGATWFSILAPLSWLVIFKPTSYTHDAIFPFIWQMPFTLLGFAFCGYVVQQTIRVSKN